MVTLAFHISKFVVLLYLRICGDNLSPSVVFSDVFLLYMGCNQINVITPLANGYLKLPKKLINCQIFYSHRRNATYNILEKSTPTNSADFFTTVKTSVDPTNAKKTPFWFALAGISYKKDIYEMTLCFVSIFVKPIRCHQKYFIIELSWLCSCYP